MDIVDTKLAREAKAIVALAFRNGPIEDVHAGRACPTCCGMSGYSRVTDEEMKLIMTTAVDHVYKLLWLRDRKPREYEDQIKFARWVPLKQTCTAKRRPSRNVEIRSEGASRNKSFRKAQNLRFQRLQSQSVREMLERTFLEKPPVVRVNLLVAFSRHASPVVLPLCRTLRCFRAVVTLAQWKSLMK